MDHPAEPEPALSHDEVRAFYDCFGRRQDRQAFYEDKALALLAARARFEEARYVFEFGCGTGRLAGQLLRNRFSADCRYLGTDISDTMVSLASERLRDWRDRAAVRLSDGAPVVDLPDHSVDRFLSTYVLDLLSPSDIRAVLGEAHRILVPRGLLCLVSLTHGERGVSRLVSWLWRGAYRRWPNRLGGCRPLRLRDFLDADRWRVVHREVVANWGIPSEVLIASATG
jgi:ubiquinone/menaquinone biosynthesis C-methylase UbiE